jgi:hypothetical protein
MISYADTTISHSPVRAAAGSRTLRSPRASSLNAADQDQHRLEVRRGELHAPERLVRAGVDRVRLDVCFPTSEFACARRRPNTVASWASASCDARSSAGTLPKHFPIIMRSILQRSAIKAGHRYQAYARCFSFRPPLASRLIQPQLTSRPALGADRDDERRPHRSMVQRRIQYSMPFTSAIPALRCVEWSRGFTPNANLSLWKTSSFEISYVGRLQ